MTKQVFTATGRRIALAAQIGRGGEGQVFALTGRPDQVAKIYHSRTLANPATKALLQAKLERAFRVDALKTNSRFAWPSEPLVDDRGAFAGFLMRRVEGTLLQTLMAPVNVERYLPNWTQAHLIRVCHDLMAGFDALYTKFDILVGDMGAGNFLVDPKTAEVRLIDTDAYQFGCGTSALLSPVMTPQFCAPESLESGAPCLRTPEQCYFGAALLCFSVLTLGASAFMQKGGDDVVSNIRRGKIAIGGAKATAFMPPAFFSRYNALPRRIKWMFNQTLREGHADPSKRIPFSDWRNAFLEYGKNLSDLRAAV